MYGCIASDLLITARGPRYIIIILYAYRINHYYKMIVQLCPQLNLEDYHTKAGGESEVRDGLASTGED